MNAPPPLPPKKPKRNPIVVILLVFLVIGGSFFAFKGFTREISEAHERVQTKSASLKVRNHLIMISVAADMYFEKHPESQKVTYSELAEFIPNALALISPVAGEDYDSVVVARHGTSVEIELPTGEVVTFEKKN